MTCMPVSQIFEVFQRNLFRVIVRPAVEVYDKFGILVQNGGGSQSVSDWHGSQISGEVSDPVQPSSDTVKAPSNGEKAPSNGEKAPSNGEKALSKTAVEVIRLLNQDSGLREIAANIHHSDLTKLRNGIMFSLLESGLVELTQPDSPRSPTQKYRLTEKGRAYLEGLKHE